MGFDYLPVRCPSLPLIYRLPVDQQEDASHHARTHVVRLLALEATSLRASGGLEAVCLNSTCCSFGGFHSSANVLLREGYQCSNLVPPSREVLLVREVPLSRSVPQ